jgi:dihydropyrimidinase
MKTLIRSGRIVTAVDDYKADILIEDGLISVIGAKLEMEADRVIDAAGKLVIPGGIDPHTHMELPFGGTFSSDDFFTGTRAAGVWRTTTIHRFRRADERRDDDGGRGCVAQKGGRKMRD